VCTDVFEKLKSFFFYLFFFQGGTIDELVNKRQSLAKAVVVAESHLASLGAEVHSALSTGCAERRPNSAMGFEMERKLVKLIDDISVHARDLSAIAEKQMSMREVDVQRRREAQQEWSGSGSGGTGGVVNTALDLNEDGLDSYSPTPADVTRYSPPGSYKNNSRSPIDKKKKKKKMKRGVLYRQNKGGKDRVVREEEEERQHAIESATTATSGVMGGGSGMQGAELLMMLKNQLFQGAREGKLFKVTQVVGTKLMDVSVSKDEEGNTALMIAVMNQHFDVAEYVAARGRDKIVNVQNLEGNTALHYSCGNVPMTKMLESYGANPSLRNMYGLLPSQGGAPKSFADFEGLMD
jgi:hypothetical protein